MTQRRPTFGRTALVGRVHLMTLEGFVVFLALIEQQAASPGNVLKPLLIDPC